MKSIIIAFVGVILIIIAGALTQHTDFVSQAQRFFTPSTQQEATGTQSPTPVAMKDQEISITDQGFSPQEVTITRGTRIIWKNNSSGLATVDSDPHPQHTSFPPLNIGEIKTGDSVRLIFTQPGIYTYHNHLNPSQAGTIRVE